MRLRDEDVTRIRQMARDIAQPLVGDRERARRWAVTLEQENAALIQALVALVKAQPATSTWAHETAAVEAATDLLTTLGIDLNGD